MSTLSAFLHPAIANEEKEIVISNRFQDEHGNPVPFKIRAITQEENDALTKKSTKQYKVNGVPQDRLDSVEFTRRLVVAGTVEPNFSDTEMCNTYGAMDPLQVPGRMLLSGEYSKLAKEIMDLSGFGDLTLDEQAKN